MAQPVAKRLGVVLGGHQIEVRGLLEKRRCDLVLVGRPGAPALLARGASAPEDMS